MTTSIKDLTSNFTKLERFDGGNFRRWQKKMHIFLLTVGLDYVLITPCPTIHEDSTLEQRRANSKWLRDEPMCRGHILNGLSDDLFDVYQNVDNAKDL